MARRRDGDGAFEISYCQPADPFRSEAISLDGIGRRGDRGRRRLRPFRRVDACGKDTARSCHLTVRHALAPSQLRSRSEALDAVLQFDCH